MDGGKCWTKEEFGVGGGRRLKGRDHLESKGVDGRLVLKWA